MISRPARTSRRRAHTSLLYVKEEHAHTRKTTRASLVQVCLCAYLGHGQRRPLAEQGELSSTAPLAHRAIVRSSRSSTSDGAPTAPQLAVRVLLCFKRHA